MTWVFEISKPTRDTPPSLRPNLLTVPKQSQQLWTKFSNIWACGCHSHSNRHITSVKRSEEQWRDMLRINVGLHGRRCLHVHPHTYKHTCRHACTPHTETHRKWKKLNTRSSRGSYAYVPWSRSPNNQDVETAKMFTNRWIKRESMAHTHQGMVLSLRMGEGAEPHWASRSLCQLNKPVTGIPKDSTCRRYLQPGYIYNSIW